ncbi:hypothetical protein AVEN_103570-1 [Araneus ventricosus]|uniref:Secreted protein n=1 Tax=Araneus ventricosus TaxID=182803 RepID=A0A4Y2G6Q3_ARAVE|nr:hypothetical protein AVEN_103570-1 [Araneus ventricosus]
MWRVVTAAIIMKGACWLLVRVQECRRSSSGENHLGGGIRQHPVPALHAGRIRAVAAGRLAHRARPERHTAAAVEHLARRNSRSHHLRGSSDGRGSLGMPGTRIGRKRQESRQSAGPSRRQ